METYTETAYHTFVEETPDALLDKECFLVALGTAENSIKLATSADDAIGVVFLKQKGNPHVSVRLLGKGGTVKVKAGGVIGKSSRVTFGTGAKLIAQPTAAGTYRTLGIKLTQGSSINNDVIEILDLIETRTVA